VDEKTNGSDQAASTAKAESATAEADWERKRRLAEIFGDVLPDTTRDERGSGTSKGGKQSAQDAWLLSQVPPHHGGHG
jgi:hypothetical protein